MIDVEARTAWLSISLTRDLEKGYGASDNSDSDSEASEICSALTPDLPALDPGLADFLAEAVALGFADADARDAPVDLRACV